MKKIAMLFPILAGILWGTAGIFIRIMHSAGMNSLTILAVRSILVPFILFGGILINDRTLFDIRINDIWLFFSASIFGTLLLNICYNESISQIPLSLAAVLLSLSPIFVVFFAKLIFKEKITVRKILCMIGALTGCAMVSGIFDATKGVTWTKSGIVIGLLSAFFYAMYSIFSKIAAIRGYSGITITFYGYVILVIVLIPLADWSVVIEFVAKEPVVNSLFILITNVFTSALPYIFLSVGLHYIEASQSAILASASEPITAAICGILFFNEVLSLIAIFGLALTIVALALLLNNN